jgi:hypothetical protein
MILTVGAAWYLSREVQQATLVWRAYSVENHCGSDQSRGERVVERTIEIHGQQAENRPLPARTQRCIITVFCFEQNNANGQSQSQQLFLGEKRSHGCQNSRFQVNAPPAGIFIALYCVSSPFLRGFKRSSIDGNRRPVALHTIQGPPKCL